MATKRTAEEIQRLLEGYRQRTSSRAEYCRQQGVSINMLAYYLQRRTRKARPRMARVKLAPSPSGGTGTFALSLRNGRRIESAWNFRDADLARLIRIAEAE
jgi:hypothetical protein